MRFKKIFDELNESKKTKKGDFKVENAIKTMLQLTYDWKAQNGDNPLLRKLDSTLFNRKQGYEVVWMIQDVIEHFGYRKVNDVQKAKDLIQKVEDIIANKLPGNVRSRKNVFDWLVDYLSKK